MHWTFAKADLIRVCPFATKFISGEPNTPPDIRRRMGCHTICKQRRWDYPIYDRLWNGSQIDKQPFPVGRFQTSERVCFSVIIRSFLSGRITTFSLLIMLPAFECKNPVLEYDFGHQSSTAFLFRCLHEKVYFSFLALYREKY